MIGILATVLVQSSSTSTSIVVTMVASGILPVRPAIPIVMGANIGTSVTNTVVSMAHSSNKNEFRRAFGGATVHDMFNWLSVLTLLPLEVVTGYLFHLTSAIIKTTNLDNVSMEKKEFLKVITKPFTKTIIQVNKKIMEKIAMGDTKYAEKSLIKDWCKYEEVVETVNVTHVQNVTDITSGAIYLTNVTTIANVTVKQGVEKCSFLFHSTGLNDTIIGLIVLAIALVMLCVCLVLMVKLLHSILNGQIAKVIKKTINADFPGKLSFLTGYLAIFIGAGMTMLVQSSSVFTSAMTPLVGIGVISLERMYPLTLGSNIGTTMTSILAAFASSGDKMSSALQISLVHLFFNISGILLYYPVPFMRRAPIKLAKIMGNTTAEYRWFALFYVFIMFFLIPGGVFALSMVGMIPLVGVLGTLFLVIAIIVIINVLQTKYPKHLPAKLQNWDFLPLWMHSLDPLDRVMRSVGGLFKRCCPCCCKPKHPAVETPRRQSLSQGQLTFLLCETPPSSTETSRDTSPSNSLISSLESTPNSSCMTSRSTSMLLHTKL